MQEILHIILISDVQGVTSIVSKTKAVFQNFKNGKLKLGAQASAIALTQRASADLAYRDGVAIVTMAKGGLMYEASVGGQKFSFQPLGTR